MALTTFQIEVLRILAESRKKNRLSYVAGGVALNEILRASRLSQDIDLFHDTTTALQVSWESDRTVLLNSGFSVDVLRQNPAFVEATVSRSAVSTLIQWTRDSAFRFFPLIEHDVLGLTLHPFDLATNKILALSGRLEPRDWIDMITCHRHLQPLGYIAWAASGKDPGVNPDMLLADAARLHYSRPEIDTLSFEGPPPSASELSRLWKDAVSSGKESIARLPVEQVGTCVMTVEGQLCTFNLENLEQNLTAGKILFHPGRIEGSWPQVLG